MMRKILLRLTMILSCATLFVSNAGCSPSKIEIFSNDGGENIIKKFPCYSSRLNTETKKLARFSKIVSDNCADIFFIQSDDEYSITVEGHFTNPLKRINIAVSNEVLRLSINRDSENVIRTGNNTRYVDSYLKVYIKAPSLSYFCGDGTSDFSCERLVQSSNLSLDMNGTGDISFTWIKLPGLTLFSSGTGDFTCDGTALTGCDLRIRGTGDIYFKSLKTKELNMNLSGTGDCKLPAVVAENVYASLSGTGDINISGICRNKASLTVSGTGDLDATNLMAKVVSANASGTGTLYCSPEETLVATRSFGTLVYYGDPAHVSTSGKVIQRKKK